MIDTMLLLSSEILKTYEVRGTELVFLLLVRSADLADRRCDRQTDRQIDRQIGRQTDKRTDRPNKGALDILVLNTLKVSSGLLSFRSFVRVCAFACKKKKSGFRTK